MPAYMWITAAALVALAVFVALGRRWLHSLWYSWGNARHVLADPLEEHYATVAMFYGSMSLDDERPLDLLPAPPAGPDPWETRRVPDWREQTAADLAPETLADEIAWRREQDLHTKIMDDLRNPPLDALDGTGPGVPPSSLTVAPGPVTDLDGGPTVSGPEGAEGVNAPAVQLGPNASRVLARWEQRFTERWSLSWDNSMEAAA